WIVGVDEAGRGPLAGPVVAGAVLLKQEHFEHKIADSKKLSHSQRLKAFSEIQEKAFFGIGMIDEKMIDQINILEATYLAMSKAVKALIATFPREHKEHENFSKQVCLLIDGNRFKSDLPYNHKPVVKGDSLSLSIAAASILAKVTRDKLMEDYDVQFPQYGFAKHKGYPTSSHKQALREHGPCKIHRLSFKY
ncbi:ribonuclease HII, partial [Candidatus Omnitrophota bacterium]